MDHRAVVEEWNKHGYALAELEDSDMAGVGEAVDAEIPTWEEFRDDPSQRKRITEGLIVAEFPYESRALNDLTLSSTLRSLAAAILKTDGIMLSQSMLWGKYARSADHEQHLHADFDDNSLVVPSRTDTPDQVPFIIYLSDVTPGLGPTHIVPKGFTESLPLSPRWKDRATYAEYYEHEQPILASAGTLLVNSMTTFHRGTQMTANAGRRVTLHVVYRRKKASWAGWSSWPRYSSPALADVLERVAVPVRNVLGFPEPGNAYWTGETIQLVGERYPAMDMTPYRAALDSERRPVGTG